MVAPMLHHLAPLSHVFCSVVFGTDLILVLVCQTSFDDVRVPVSVVEFGSRISPRNSPGRIARSYSGRPDLRSRQRVKQRGAGCSRSGASEVDQVDVLAAGLSFDSQQMIRESLERFALLLFIVMRVIVLVDYRLRQVCQHAVHYQPKP